MQPRKCELRGQSEKQSELRAKHQEGRKQSAGRSRRIGQGTEREPHEKNQGKQAKRSSAEQRSLSDLIASANKIGKKPGERANSGPDERRADLNRPMVEAVDRRHRLQEHAIVDDRHDAGERAENEEERPDREVRHDQRAQMKILPVAQNRAGDRDGARRGAERGDRDPQFEPPHQFLEHEDGAGDRRVERRGEAGPRPGGKQHAAIGPIASKNFADQMAQGPGHVHARPLAAERKPGADRERAADELHRNDTKRRLRHLPSEDGFDLRDAAAGRLGRDPANQRSRDSRSHRASRDDEPDALGPLRMGKSEKRIAQLIRLFEQEHEAGDASAGDRAHDERQNGQEREAPALASQFGNHSLGARYRLPEVKRAFVMRPPVRISCGLAWSSLERWRFIRNLMLEPIPDRTCW